jgi:putative toxin-antitoxin system antitoxin component (TIGR02293 family)
MAAISYGAGGDQHQRTAALLGGSAVLKRPLRDSFDVHEAIKAGLPGIALQAFVAALQVLTPLDIEKVLGMSLRTLQRKKGATDKTLSPEQAGRTWQFAEILAQAAEVFGSQENAERWLTRPAMALNNHRPLDLLSTPTGVEMVKDLLGRIAYGVYA